MIFFLDFPICNVAWNGFIDLFIIRIFFFKQKKETATAVSWFAKGALSEEYLSQMGAEGWKHFLQLLVWERQEKPEVGTEVGKGVKNNWKEIWPYLCQILFDSCSNLPFANCEGLSAALERLSHAARSELRPRLVSQALQHEAPSSHLPRGLQPAILLRPWSASSLPLSWQ